VSESTEERLVRRLTARAGYRLWKPRNDHDVQYWPYAPIYRDTKVILDYFTGRQLDEIREFMRSRLERRPRSRAGGLVKPPCLIPIDTAAPTQLIHHARDQQRRSAHPLNASHSQDQDQ
jgi:hypothetical protein